MPIYYRNKFYTEEERELLWREKIDKHRIYVNGIQCDKIDTEEGRKNYEKIIRAQQEDNEALGYGNNSIEWKSKKHLITLKMINEAK